MRTKSVFLTLLVLSIGVVIGFLVGGNVTMHKLHKARDMHTEHGFMKHVFESLDLEMHNRDSVRVIMEEFARLNHQKHRKLQDEIHELHIELEKNLTKYLSEEELIQFRQKLRRRGRSRPISPPHGIETNQH